MACKQPSNLFQSACGFVRLCIITAVSFAFFGKTAPLHPHLMACKWPSNLFKSALRLRAAFHHYGSPFCFFGQNGPVTLPIWRLASGLPINLLFRIPGGSRSWRAFLFAFLGKIFPLRPSRHPVNFHLVACKWPSDRFFYLLCSLDNAVKINAGLNAHLRK